MIGASLGSLTGFAMNPPVTLVPKLFRLLCRLFDVALTGGRDNLTSGFPIRPHCRRPAGYRFLYVKVLAPASWQPWRDQKPPKLSNKEEAAA